MLTIKTKEEFDKIIEMIKANVNHYETYLTEVHYKLFLANKKVVDIDYLKECIPHLLGIDMDYLRSTNLYREKSAYDLMKNFLNNNYTLYSRLLDNSGRVFSDYVVTKNESFKDNLKIVVSDIDCIVEYKKDRVYGLDIIECSCDYYILQKRSETNVILLLGLVKKGNVYVPQTSQRLDLTLSKDQESLKKILFHQHITFCNNLRYSNNYDMDSKCFFLDIQSKSNKLLALNRYGMQYSSFLSVDGDYAFILKKLNEANINETRMKALLQDITAMISTGDVIDVDSLGEDVDDDIKGLVSSYNNSRVIETSSFKYSELLEEYNKLKNEVEKLRIQNEELQSCKATQAETIESLKSENKDYKETHNKIFTLLQNANGGGLSK